MKKVLFVAALGMLTLASCKKDYTCECTTTIVGFSSTATTTINATKKDAKTACENGTNASSYTTCVIK
jgi:hypothetical protein